MTTDNTRAPSVENDLTAEALGCASLEVRLAYTTVCAERDGLKALVTNLLRELNAIAGEIRKLREAQELLASSANCSSIEIEIRKLREAEQRLASLRPPGSPGAT
jgi:hypothetical protein